MTTSKRQPKLLYRFIKQFARSVIKLTYHIKVIGLENLEGHNPCIVASNHISLMDPPIIGSFIPWETTFIAKSELFKNKIFGGIIRALNAIPIRRAIFDRAALEIASQRLEDNYAVLIFPEGSRKSFSVKPGIGKLALGTKNNVVPVFLKNSNKFWQCVFFMKRLTLVIGKPIEIKDFIKEEETKDDYRELADIIYQRILELEKKC